uniref:1-acylglycerol-3-phosphate O-acyltransferase n=1 Tax=Chenopodium quinoa TaxID=63459 RepID=A0A803MA76_CHEQI
MAIPAVAVMVPMGLLFFISGFIVNVIQATCFIFVRPLSKNTYRRINRFVAELLWLELVWIVDWWAGVQPTTITLHPCATDVSHSGASLMLGTLSYTFFLLSSAKPYCKEGCYAMVHCKVMRLKSHTSHIAEGGGDRAQGLHRTVGSPLELVFGDGYSVIPKHQIKVFTDPATFQQMGKEHALVVSNHKSDIDWLRAGCLGSTLAVMKKSSKLLPVIGWSMWFSEYLFLERSWAKDERTLKLGLQRLKDYPLPFWLALFVEGTRFTQAKLLAAQEYAASTGLPVPRNVLIPRTKGFVTAVSHMRSFVPAIYDVTVAIPKSSPPPTMLRLFKGQSSVVHVHIKRHNMQDLPKTDDAVAQWCKDVFVAKDALLDKHKADDTFGDQHLQDSGRPLKSLVVVTIWAITIILGSIKFLQWSSLLSTWKGIAFSAVGLGIVTILMQILIQFSQSERSTPARQQR